MQGGVQRLVSALLAVLLVVAASTDETPGRWTQIPLDVSGEQPSPANCTVVTSDCEACALRADGTFACSTPGIALLGQCPDLLCKRIGLHQILRDFRCRRSVPHGPT